MGILNRTCSISNTPIINGQNVRIFFLASCRGRYQQQSPQFSNLESHFIPNIYSQYNVIGGIGLKAVADDEKSCFFKFDHSSFEANYILSKIKQSYYMLKESDDQENMKSMADEESLNIKSDDLTFEKVLNLIENGDLYLRSIMRRDVFDSVSIMAVHEDVYQMLLSDHQEEYTHSGYVDMTFDYFLKNESEKRKQWNKANEAAMIRYIEICKKLNLNFSEEELRNMDLTMGYGMSKFGYDYESNYTLNGSEPYSEMLSLKSETNAEISEDDIFLLTTEMKFFVKKMHEYNLMLRPTITSGDERDYEIFVNFYKNMKNVVSGIMKRTEEEFD